MSENEIQPKQENFFTQWLEKLQQESWQLELIISSIALYLIYEARDYLESFAVYAEMYDHFEINPFGFASDVFYGSWIIFITNLVIHILSRGFWIGAIGLRYVSGEVDFKALKYSEIFEKHLEKKVGRFDAYIEKLERFCSIMYAYTFLLFFIFVSIMAYFGVLVLITQGIDMVSENLEDQEKGMFIGLIGLAYLVFGLIYAIDVVFMGAFKKVKDKTLSKIYFYIYRVFNIITLSFFYRSLVYNFIDNAYSRRFIWASIPYFVIVFLLIPNIKVVNSANFPIPEGCLDCPDEKLVMWTQYDDLRAAYLQNNQVDKEKSIISLVSLGKYEVTDHYQSIFLRMLAKDDQYLEKIMGVQPNLKTGFIMEIQNQFVEDSTEENIKKYFTKEKARLTKLRMTSKDERIRSALSRQVDSLNDVKKDSLDRYYKQINDLRIQSFMTIFDMEIDGIPYTDSLQCRWFIHPNNGEKGVLCYFPVKNMPPGWHKVHVKKKIYEERDDDRLKQKKDTFRISHIEVPFFKKN